MRRVSWVPAIVLLLGGVLTGCSDDDGADEPDASGACNLLSDDQIGDLTGAEVSSGPRTVDVADLPACQWKVDGGAAVQVISVPAGDWARSLPDAVDQLKSSGLLDDGETSRKLEEASDLIASGKDVPPAQACELFSSLVEVQGLEPGSERVVNLVPSAEDPQAISAQTCTDGQFASVLFSAPDLEGSDTEQRRAEAALDSVLDAVFDE